MHTHALLHFLFMFFYLGGGIAVNLMQRLVAEKKTKLLPVGAVLMCPFVDYTEPKGSMLHYICHDLIVNQVSCDELLRFRRCLLMEYLHA